MFFRYAADRKPVFLILLMSLIDIAVFLLVANPWVLAGYWLFMITPKGLIAPWNHHHQHCMTFRQPVLNRLIEQVYALHTGMTTNLWVLHHVLGHHINYLDQSLDESRWKRKSGKKMGVIEYTLSVASTAYYRAFRVGRRYPKQQRLYLVCSAITFLLVAGLVAWRPIPALFIFVLPMVCTLLYTSWVTYDHHAGLEGEDHFSACYNILNPWFNRLTGNLGYHSAHHFKQGVHWSMLPELHAEIADRIAPECFVKSTFDVFLPGKEPDRESTPLAEDGAAGGTHGLSQG